MTLKLDIPDRAPFLEKTFHQTHVLLRLEPNNDPDLAYELLLPKQWAYAREFGPLQTGLLQDRAIGMFTGSVEPEAPVIGAVVTQVPYEIPVDAWARASFVQEGYEIVAAKWFPGATGLYFDITGMRVVDDVPQVRRTGVRVRGDKIFSLNCMTAHSNWDAVKEHFWLAISSFKLAHTSKARMEPWLQARMEREPHFEVAHPATWLSEPVESSPDGVSALDIRLVDADVQMLLGYVQVKAVQRAANEPAPPLENLKNIALANVERSGFATNEALEPVTEDVDPRSIAVEGWLGACEVVGRIGEGDVTLRLGFVDRGGLTFTFLMLSPTLANNPLIALRTLRVFEIARATLKV